MKQEFKYKTLDLVNQKIFELESKLEKQIKCNLKVKFT